MSENRGWTWFGRSDHAVKWRGYTPIAACHTCVLAQTIYRQDGQQTGALVPRDLKPCKKKACQYPSADDRTAAVQA